MEERYLWFDCDKSAGKVSNNFFASKLTLSVRRQYQAYTRQICCYCLMTLKQLPRLAKVNLGVGHRASYCLLAYDSYYIATSRPTFNHCQYLTMKTMIERSHVGGAKMGRNNYLKAGSLPAFTKFSFPPSSKSTAYQRHPALHKLPAFQKLPLRLKHRAMSPTTRSSTKRSREDAAPTTNAASTAAEEPPAKVQKVSEASGMLQCTPLLGSIVNS